MNSKMKLLIDSAVKVLDNENKRYTDSAILMKLMEFSDVEIEQILKSGHITSKNK